jgi:hypothetical protein
MKNLLTFIPVPYETLKAVEYIKSYRCMVLVFVINLGLNTVLGSLSGRLW